jgi:hypothetical protein
MYTEELENTFSNNDKDGQYHKYGATGVIKLHHSIIINTVAPPTMAVSSHCHH